MEYKKSPKYTGSSYTDPYIGCPGRNVPDFGRMFLMLKYTDLTQNTYIHSWTVLEIMAREKCGLLVVPYTKCPGGNVPDFRRMFLTLNYTDLTQNTYIQSWMVTEIMAREKCGLLVVPHTVPIQLMLYPYAAHVHPWECNAVNVVGLHQNAQPAMLN